MVQRKHVDDILTEDSLDSQENEDLKLAIQLSLDASNQESDRPKVIRTNIAYLSINEMNHEQTCMCHSTTVWFNSRMCHSTTLWFNSRMCHEAVKFFLNS